MYIVDDKVILRIPDPKTKSYREYPAVIKESDGKTLNGGWGEDWYTVTLESGEIVRVRESNIYHIPK